jgi:hypothetical protein
MVHDLGCNLVFIFQRSGFLLIGSQLL